MAVNVLFEDDDLIAVEKSAGIPAQSTIDKNRTNFYNLVKSHLRVEVFLHHRLDKDTSGVMIFSKTRKMNPLLMKLFQNHQIQKTYLALTVGNHLKKEFRVENYLSPQKNSKPQKMKSVQTGGDKAITDFQVLETFNGSELLKCHPKTGRTHQIRVHLSEIGRPILGDFLYGGASSAVPRMMLHALQLEFQHPLTGKNLVILCPTPKDFTSVLRAQQSYSELQ